MKTSKKLPAGQYMKVDAVQSYFQSVNLKSTLVVITVVCPMHEGEYGLYYDTADLKNVIEPSLFRELECDVITHIIPSKVEYLKSIGAEIHDSFGTEVLFTANGYDYGISFSDFEIGDSLETICQNADLYSCCGDIVDQDWMMCPSCKEHV